MTLMAALTHVTSLKSPKPTPKPFNLPHLKRTTSSCSVDVPNTLFFSEKVTSILTSGFLKSPTFSLCHTSSIRSFSRGGAENYEPAKPKDSPNEQDGFADEILKNQEIKAAGPGSSFLAKLATAVGVAATITILSVGLKLSSLGSSLGVQRLPEGSSSSSVMASSVGFSFKAFGYNFIVPQYAPGWIYFWLLMAAGCGLFISEEALNIWVCPLYWGVCISDMIPFYLGKLFRQSGASDDVYSKLGIGKEKALSITRSVQKYGNLIGFVERFSLGVRNPTAFLAGSLGISPDCFFAGVCCGGFLTLPIQLVIGFLLRERPVFALATVATVVGIWTVFPYAVAAATAMFLYLQRRFST